MARVGPATHPYTLTHTSTPLHTSLHPYTPLHTHTSTDPPSSSSRPPGQVQFRSRRSQDHHLSGSLAPLRYLDDQGLPTEEYPLNPNGSPEGVAAPSSKDGRHLAMMPHPERCTLGWQWPWAPRGLRASLTPSPWMRMFRNAAAWTAS